MWLAQALAKKSMKVKDIVILEESLITISKGIKEKYTLHWDGILYDLPEEYVNDKFINVISNE